MAPTEPIHVCNKNAKLKLQNLVHTFVTWRILVEVIIKWSNFHHMNSYGHGFFICTKFEKKKEKQHDKHVDRRRKNGNWNRWPTVPCSHFRSLLETDRFGRRGCGGPRAYLIPTMCRCVKKHMFDRHMYAHDSRQNGSRQELDWMHA